MIALLFTSKRKSISSQAALTFAITKQQTAYSRFEVEVAYAH